MKLLLALCLAAVASVMPSDATEGSIATVLKNGRPHVSASALAADAGITIKTLPGQTAVAACLRDRCALVKETVREEGEVFVPVQSLADALGLVAVEDSGTRRVRFEPARNLPSAGALGTVGSLAPNFTLRRLDGTPVSVSDFRGKRVLINSWARW